MGPDELVTGDAMAAIRSSREEIFKMFEEYLWTYYESITRKKVSLLFISLTMRITVNEDVSELSRSFGENHILPKLPEKDKRALADLVAFLEGNPVNPENIAAEFMPYSIALGQNDFWMSEFHADPGQRNIVDYPEIMDPMPKRPRKTGVGFYYHKSDKRTPR